MYTNSPVGPGDPEAGHQVSLTQPGQFQHKQVRGSHALEIGEEENKAPALKGRPSLQCKNVFGFQISKLVERVTTSCAETWTVLRMHHISVLLYDETSQTENIKPLLVFNHFSLPSQSSGMVGIN